MTRGEATQIKVHYKGTSDDFIVFLDSVADYKKWLADRSTPLAQVVSSFKVFCTHKQGAQGTLDGASKADLENEFGSSVDEEVIVKILEQGNLQESQMNQRNASRNDADGAMVNH